MKTFTLEEVQEHASAASCWITIEGKVYDVTSWLDKHPGGQLPLINQAGRDATDAFTAFHPEQVRSKLSAFCIGELEEQPRDVVAEDFRKLRAELVASGLFKPTPLFYAKECTFILGLVAVMLRLLAAGGWPGWLLGGFTLGIIWQQTAFIGHDAGHNALSGRRGVDSAFGLLLGNSITGVGIGWWKATHNVHHNVVNSASHDPDIQHMPFLAISPLAFSSPYSRFHMDTLLFTPAARALVSMQHILFFPLLCVARYGLVLQGIKTVGWEWHKRHTGFWRPGSPLARAAEALAFAGYFGGLCYLITRLPSLRERAAFTAVAHATFAIMHLQINLAHWSKEIYMGVPQGGWARTQLASTLNWACPEHLDWFHGGLQFQIEHHLFPRMPRPNLRKASGRVKEFCQAHGLEYHQVSFWAATAEILGTLRDTAMAARRLAPVGGLVDHKGH